VGRRSHDAARAGYHRGARHSDDRASAGRSGGHKPCRSGQLDATRTRGTPLTGPGAE
jgi:hypothetical protein